MKYFIKKNGYYYDDDTHNPAIGELNYYTEALEKKAAEERLLKLELQEYRTGYGFHEFWELRQQPFGVGAREKYINDLNEFSQSNFGTTFYTGHEPTYPHWTMPGTATLDQVREFRELSGIRFYELVEAQGDAPKLFGIYLTGNWTKFKGWSTYNGIKYLPGDDGNRIPGREEKIVPHAFASREAVASLKANVGFTYGDSRAVLRGTAASLSEHPALLESFVATQKGIAFEPLTGELTMERWIYGLNWVALNELLKLKIFEIRELPAEVIRESNGYHYDAY